MSEGVHYTSSMRTEWRILSPTFPLLYAYSLTRKHYLTNRLLAVNVLAELLTTLFWPSVIMSRSPPPPPLKVSRYE
jgi:hypothetical protein